MSLAKLQDLTGRVALVTGGSRGLGLQMAELLGELGAKVAITARKAHGGPEDLKGVTALLASDACAFLTGQTIAVDGGVVAAY